MKREGETEEKRGIWKYVKKREREREAREREEGEGRKDRER